MFKKKPGAVERQGQVVVFAPKTTRPDPEPELAPPVLKLSG